MTSATIFTRRELARYIGDAFENGTVGRGELVDLMVDRNAPTELVALVDERLPVETRLAGLRGVWNYLGDMPVDRT